MLLDASYCGSFALCARLVSVSIRIALIIARGAARSGEAVIQLTRLAITVFGF